MKVEMEVDPGVADLILRTRLHLRLRTQMKDPDREGALEFLAGEHDFSEDG
jgi:hypothetical protein